MAGHFIFFYFFIFHFVFFCSFAVSWIKFGAVREIELNMKLINFNVIVIDVLFKMVVCFVWQLPIA